MRLFTDNHWLAIRAVKAWHKDDCVLYIGGGFYYVRNVQQYTNDKNRSGWDIVLDAAPARRESIDDCTPEEWRMAACDAYREMKYR